MDEILSRCKWSDWQIIDDFWNHEFVCTYGCGHFCYADDKCHHYEPEERNVNDDSKKRS